MFPAASECQKQLRLCCRRHVDRTSGTMRFKTNALDLSVNNASCSIKKETEIKLPKTYLGCGPGSVVGIATDYGAGRTGDRIPVGARFSPPVQTGPGAHPTSCTMGTGSFPGVKSGRGVTLTPHPLLVPWS